MVLSRAFRVLVVLLAVSAVASAPTAAVEINKELVQDWKVLVKGSPIHGANGVAFDSHDQHQSLGSPAARKHRFEGVYR